MKTSCNRKKAGIFSAYFASVWTKEPHGPLPHFKKRITVLRMEEIKVNEEDVLELLLNLKTDKAPGPDGVHPTLLKNLAK